MTAEPSAHAQVSGTSLLVQLSGEMDYQTASFFRERLVDVMTWAQRRVVLDLSAVSFCDSAGLNVLVEAWRRTEQADAVLVLACVPPNLKRMLSVTGVDTVLRVYDSLAVAVAVAEPPLGTGTSVVRNDGPAQSAERRVG
ncbi:STAS domain-containing protein [Streptomyces sp. NPDC086783]|uniref:STAS domain-containing protein n=1 Tax=Streptomyces sp. NPDC086783 TaxID=3365758 RepID=UPI00381D4AAE